MHVCAGCMHIYMQQIKPKQSKCMPRSPSFLFSTLPVDIFGCSFSSAEYSTACFDAKEGKISDFSVCLSWTGPAYLLGKVLLDITTYSLLLSCIDNSSPAF